MAGRDASVPSIAPPFRRHSRAPAVNTVLAIDQLPESRRASAWRDAVCETFVHLECRHHGSAVASGRIEARVFDGLHVARVRNSAQQVERLRQGVALDDAAYVLMSLQVRGRTIVEQCGRRAELLPGSLAFYDTARPYSLIMPVSSDQFVLHVPRSLVEANVPAALDATACQAPSSNSFATALLALAPHLLHGSTSPAGNDGIDTGNGVDNGHDNHHGHAMQRHAQATATGLMLLALNALASGNRRHSDLPPVGSWRRDEPIGSAHAEAIVQRAFAAIEHHLADPSFGPAQLAAVLRISLRRLQEVCQASGESPSALIRHRRLDAALSLLTAHAFRGHSISAIAHRVGFADMAHFSRSFRARFGCSPREHRDAGKRH